MLKWEGWDQTTFAWLLKNHAEVLAPPFNRYSITLSGKWMENGKRIRYLKETPTPGPLTPIAAIKRCHRVLTKSPSTVRMDGYVLLDRNQRVKIGKHHNLPQWRSVSGPKWHDLETPVWTTVLYLKYVRETVSTYARIGCEMDGRELHGKIKRNDYQ